ncbi:MAG: hypothetical protein KIT11_02845 [Fimbriimonadaceae bacterium]|nr:hypothetical protein [Fimbriimonadaceae bacterium]QYK54694.1 MAG: hypothetical protein KF733_06680 [Fimbriimonadaceae bacterium]
MLCASAVDLGPTMPLGDSITSGYPVPGGYRGFLQDRLTTSGYSFDFVGPSVENSAGMIDPEHAGFGGWTLLDLCDGRDGKGNVAKWVALFRPRLILLMAGTNDYFTPLPEMESRYRRLIEEAGSCGATVYWGSVTKTDYPNGQSRNVWAAQLDSLIRLLCAEQRALGRQVFYVDMFSALDPATDLADYIHPNAAGQAKISERWHRAITSPKIGFAGRAVDW